MPAVGSHGKSRKNESIRSWTECESIPETGLTDQRNHPSLPEMWFLYRHISPSICSIHRAITPLSHLHPTPHLLPRLRLTFLFLFLRPRPLFSSLSICDSFVPRLTCLLCCPSPGLWRSTADPATPTRSSDWPSPAATASEYRPSVTPGRVLSPTPTPSAPPSLCPLPSKVKPTRKHLYVTSL